VYDFFRRSSVIEASKKAFLELAKDVMEIARAEGLGAHAHSVSIRAAKEKPKNEK
jgi:histidinol dehydrogenase